MTKTAIAIRHVHFEDLGIFEEVLAASGIAFRYIDAGIDDIAACDGLTESLVVVLGGPIGAYEEYRYPFLREEIKLLKGRLERDLPTLGICLGAQLMARALGATVYPAATKEVGWRNVDVAAAGMESPLARIAEAGSAVFHWHGDTFDLPQGAVRLASTRTCPNQAFSWKRCGLALQFHAEVRSASIERWLIGHAVELSQPSMPEPTRLREDTSRFGPRLEPYARACFAEWLCNVGIFPCCAGVRT